MTKDDRKSVIDIFNYYVENSFAAYPEMELPYEFYDTFLNMCRGYPNAAVRNETAEVVGFGMLRPYSPVQTFSRTAEITYFIGPDHTGHGLGKRLLDFLVDEGRSKSISSILASISSLNEGSIRFHAKHGFVECGRFRSIGQKRGKVFDVVYYQKML
jgi:phosphinothricin acetyltransferase